ncbi:MAG TPA: hypothetical protein VK623_00750 [Flavobacterium sp.]|nr:hypothetical protein [Flavobacterium sp.]
MEEKDYLKDISEIKNMMNKSSQFISLSGLSGVLAGIYALVGAFIAHRIVAEYHMANSAGYDFQRNSYAADESDVVKSLTMIAVGVLILSLMTGIFLSTLKAKKIGETIWNSTSKRLIVNFMIPLVTGGAFTILLLRDEYYDLIAPATLLFYGLACVNGGKYTFRDVRYLGLSIVFLGLVATAFRGYSLLLWSIGFGFCHIFYGAIMHFKYDRK